MRKPYKESKPSKFEVAMEKGDYKMTRDLQPVTFRDYLKGYVWMFYRLGLPDSTTMHWLGVFFALDEDVKKTALILGISRGAFYQRLAILERHFSRNCNPNIIK